MKKYYIGILVLAGLTVVLTVFVLLQGANAKKDAESFKRATAIASQLNNYVDSKQTVPESLEAAKITDVPSTITYTKKSSSQYEFCVEYKTASAFDGASLTAPLTGTSLLEQQYKQNSDSLYSDSYAGSQLYINSYHKKGKDCQTVKPIVQRYPIKNEDDYIKQLCAEPAYSSTSYCKDYNNSSLQ